MKKPLLSIQIILYSLFSVSSNAGSPLMSYSAVTTTNASNLPVAVGNANQEMIRIDVTMTAGTGAANTLTSITVNMTGSATTLPSTNIGAIKIYYTGTSTTFSTSTLFGTAASLPATTTTDIAITGSQLMSGAGTYYFWVVYDIKAAAKDGDILDATCPSVIIGGTARTPTVTAPTGYRMILLESVRLFNSGDQVIENGVLTASTYFRIPAIVTAANGDLVTATTARFGNNNDLNPGGNIIIRRSNDKGKTWLTPQTIADYGTSGQASATDDALLCVDRTTGKIICMFISGTPIGTSTSASPSRINICTSSDNGVTWTTPVDITNQLYGSGCSNTTTKNWAMLWIASGQFTQLRSGRLAAIAAVRTSNAMGVADMGNAYVYSDDGGTTWQIANISSLANYDGTAGGSDADETKVVELNNGNLIMSCRDNDNVAQKRKYRVSTDGGVTWGAASSWTGINDSRVDGDIIRYSSTLDGAPQNVLLHSLAANTTTTRQNISIFTSTDEGTTFGNQKNIYPDLAQYSALTVLKDGSVGIYYEVAPAGQPFQMYFGRISAAALGITNFSTLPVQLLNFDVELMNHNTLLKWSSSNEQDFRGYSVECSSDGVNFKSIAFVPAKQLGGTNFYEYEHTGVAPGTAWYRLKMMDASGTYKYSFILKVYVPELSSIKIYPTAVKDKLVVDLGNEIKEGTYNLQVYHLITGVEYKKILFSVNNTTVNLSDLKPGTYVVKIINEQGRQIVSRKIVKL